MPMEMKKKMLKCWYTNILTFVSVMMKSVRFWQRTASLTWNICGILSHRVGPSYSVLKSRAGALHNVDAQLLKVRKERETEAENSIMQRNRLVIFHQSPFFRLWSLRGTRHMDDYYTITAAAAAAPVVWQEDTSGPGCHCNPPPPPPHPTPSIRSRLECLYLEFSFPLLWLLDH